MFYEVFLYKMSSELTSDSPSVTRSPGDTKCDKRTSASDPGYLWTYGNPEPTNSSDLGSDLGYLWKP